MLRELEANKYISAYCIRRRKMEYTDARHGLPTRIRDGVSFETRGTTKSHSCWLYTVLFFFYFLFLYDESNRGPL